MLEQINATLDKIYSAGTGASRWQDALVAIEELTGSAGAVIDLIPRTPGMAGKTFAGSFTEDNCAEYARDYQAVCPRIRRAVEHPEERVQFDYQFMTEAGMDRDPVYDWFGKHGLRYYIGGAIGEMPSYLGYFSVQRTRRQGHADASDVALFELLRPHVARAASLADQLGTLRCYQGFSSALLDALPQAVFALDSSARVLVANGPAQRLIATADGLAVEAGQLRASLLADQARLAAMIQAAIEPVNEAGRAWARVSRPSGGLPLALFVAPLNVADEQLAAAGAKVLVIVHDTAELRCASVEMLTSVYGLTDTEARLASALSGGHSLESAATLLHMRPATARSHLKAVFRKMGVSRQQDLVRVLASIATMSGTPL